MKKTKIAKAATDNPATPGKAIDMSSELGKTGLNQTAGEIFEEKLKALQREKRFEVYQEMADNDATIGAILFVVDQLIRNVEFTVNPATQSPEHIADAEFLKGCMDDLDQPWEEVISEIFGSMLVQGFAPLEIVLKRRTGMGNLLSMKFDEKPVSRFMDDKVGWSKLSLRAPETIHRWDLAPNGDIKGFWQKAPPDYIDTYIPIQKVLLFRTSVRKNNPEGRSILRNAYRSWFLKKRIENLEAIGIERDLAGLPMALVPPEIMRQDAAPEEKAIFHEIKRIVTNIRRDEQEGLVFPNIRDDSGNPMYEFKLMTAGGSRQFKTDESITRYRQDMAMTMLADFIFLGHEAVGSKALASSKTQIFSSALGAWIKAVCAIFNRKAIPMLFAANGRPTEQLPVLTHGDIETVDLAELGTYLQALTSAGIAVNDPKAATYLKSQANIPVEDNPEGEIDDEDEPTQAEKDKVVETPPSKEPTGTEDPEDIGDGE